MAVKMLAEGPYPGAVSPVVSLSQNCLAARVRLSPPVSNYNPILLSLFDIFSTELMNELKKNVLTLKIISFFIFRWLFSFIDVCLHSGKENLGFGQLRLCPPHFGGNLEHSYSCFRIRKLNPRDMLLAQSHMIQSK